MKVTGQTTGLKSKTGTCRKRETTYDHWFTRVKVTLTRMIDKLVETSNLLMRVRQIQGVSP